MGEDPQHCAMLFVRLLHAVVLCGPSDSTKQSENTRPLFPPFVFSVI